MHMEELLKGWRIELVHPTFLARQEEEKIRRVEKRHADIYGPVMFGCGVVA